MNVRVLTSQQLWCLIIPRDECDVTVPSISEAENNFRKGLLVNNFGYERAFKIVDTIHSLIYKEESHD